MNALLQQRISISVLIIVVSLIINVWSHRHRQHEHHFNQVNTDLSLWINEQQVKMFSGFSMRIYAIDNGRVSMHIKNPNFNHYLPIIPSEVSVVNFTWCSGKKKYYYHFDRMQSLDESVLKTPIISIKTQGKVPQEAKGMNENDMIDILLLVNLFIEVN